MENPYKAGRGTQNHEILNSWTGCSISFPTKPGIKFSQKNAEQSTKVRVN